MRRVAVLAVALTLACAAPAGAFSAGYLTIDPKEPGKGTVATIDVRLPRGNGAPAALVLRMARGTKWRNRAVAGRCGDAQAAGDQCPAASRIGGGRATVESTPGGGRFPVDIDLYLAPRRRTEDAAGVVMVTRTAGRTGHATGRVFELDPNVYTRKGLQLRLERVQRALFGIGLRQLNVHFGVHRTVDGRRVDLVRSPRTCGVGGWPWTIGLEEPNGSGGFFHGSINCAG